MKRILYPILLLILMISCNEPENDNIPQVVCTTGMIGDACGALLGNIANVKTLMGPGVDPHLYKATQGDISILSRADIIVYNGLHLEGKMAEIFHKLENQKTVIAMSDNLSEGQLINSSDYQGAYDPHIWMDVKLWSEAVDGLAGELKKVFPAQSELIERNRASYISSLDSLDNYIKTSITKIPDNQRVLITAHDAFKYFGRAYGLEVKGLQGISTTAEYGLKDVSELVYFISENRIKAIFVESSVPPRAIEAVMEGSRQRGHEVKLGGELYSDAMGAEGSGADTYPGMISHNVHTIIDALQ